jgi:arylformamidase
MLAARAWNRQARARRLGERHLVGVPPEGHVSIYDISPIISESIAVWPGDTPFSRSLTFEMARGAAVNVSAVTLSTHTGSHVDAPFHFLAAGASIERLPLEPFIGPALLIDAAGAERVEPRHLAPLDATPAERVLVRTRARSNPSRFDERFAPLAPEAAQRLVDLGVRLYGTDAASLDGFDSKALASHRILAGAGVMILEGLVLDEPPAGAYELIALPLKIGGADGAPVRAVLRALPGGGR